MEITAKTIDLLNINNALSSASYEGVSGPGKWVVIDVLEKTGAVVERYEKTIEAAKKVLIPSSYQENIDKINAHNTAVKEKKEEGRLSEQEIVFLQNEMGKIRADVYKKEFETGQTLVTVCVGQLTIADFEKFLGVNEKSLTGAAMLLIKKYIVENREEATK